MKSSIKVCIPLKQKQVHGQITNHIENIVCLDFNSKKNLNISEYFPFWMSFKHDTILTCTSSEQPCDPTSFPGVPDPLLTWPVLSVYGRWMNDGEMEKEWSELLSCYKLYTHFIFYLLGLKKK